jgi:thioredoxin 1
MSSILEQTEPDLGKQITFAKLNISENMELGATLGISTLPTLLLYKDGKLVGQKTGIVTKPNLTSWLSQ